MIGGMTMFVVSQDGTKCTELKNVHYVFDYDEKIKEELQQIYDARYDKRYNYGSTDNCLWHIKEAQKEHISYNGYEKVCYLYVNGDVYGTYDDAEEGKSVFENILSFLECGSNLINLSIRGE